MTHPVADAIGRLLDLTRNPPSDDAGIDRLIACLDELAWLTHSLEYVSDETEYADPPKSDWLATSARAQSWVPEKLADFEPCAANDLAETLDDLAEIRWRFEHTSEADALFYFELGFRSHWGHHLRSLQKTLHAWYW